MALNITSTGGGDIKPYVKFNSKADKWFVKKEGAEEVEEIARPTFVADFTNIKTGWFHYAEGQAPNIVLDPSLQTPAAKPSDLHKRGFQVDLYSKNTFGGVAVMTGASMHLCNAFNELYEAYEAGLADNKGKLPVVECAGSTPMKDKYGTNYKPTLKIVKWVDRPTELAGTSTEEEIPFEEPKKKVANSVSEF